MERFERRPQEEAAIRGEQTGIQGVAVNERLEMFRSDAEELLNDRNVRLGMAAGRLAKSELEGTDLVKAAKMEIIELLGRDAEYEPEVLAEAARLIRERQSGTKQ